MKKMHALLALSACALLLPLAASAAVPGLHTQTLLGINTVFYRPNDADHGQWGKGGQVKFGMGPGYAVQGLFDVANHTAGGSNYRDVPMQFSLIGYFTPETPASFFLLAGYGWYVSRVDGPGGHSETSSRPHVGAGLELVWTERLTLDASYRFIWSQVYRLSDYGHPLGSAFKDRGNLLTLAANIRF